jgi:hypothetical protein
MPLDERPRVSQMAEAAEAPACDPIDQKIVDPLIEDAAKQNSLDPKLLRAVIGQESAFRPCAVSVKGAQGLMQLMPETAAELGVANPFDPKQNLDGGSRFLKQLLAKYKGDLPLALGAYNAGPKTVDDSGGVPDLQETREYVDAILAKAGIKPAGWPAKSAETATKPVEQSTKPADAPAKPVEAPAKPIDPAPKDLAAKPADSPAKPADVPAKPTDAQAKPDIPLAKPADPSAKPTDAPAMPAASPAKPVDMALKPADSPAKPAAPAKPDAATPKPADATSKPANPPAKPAASPAKPADPVAKPADPPAKPAGNP